MIRENVRTDGSRTYTAQLRIKRGGKVVFSEARNFERKSMAEGWLAKRRFEMSQPGALDKAATPKGTLADAIDKYTDDVDRIGKTKAQVLRTIKNYEISEKQMSEIRSNHIVDLGRQLGSEGREPQTVGNYISHLSAVFSVARSAYGYEVSRDVMRDAQESLKRLGLVGKSEKRDRRPTVDEMNKLMQHFEDIKKRRPSSNPMVKICIFGLFATRRQEEIVTIKWEDLDEKHSRILVRDMKHPGQKIGNDVWCDLPAEAMAIIKTMPHTRDEIFPFSTDAISASFTRACQFLEIEDLHFHDLRHEGISRLFEMGATIPQAATVSGHRSWQSLQRYSHLRQTGDKWAGWKWLKTVAPEVDHEERAM